MAVVKADPTDKKSSSIDRDNDGARIMQERLLWVLRPIAIVCLFVWVVYPATTETPVVDRNILLGFLLGASLGFLTHRRIYLSLLTTRVSGREVKNRVPEEFYFGHVKEVMFSK